MDSVQSSFHWAYLYNGIACLFYDMVILSFDSWNLCSQLKY